MILTVNSIIEAVFNPTERFATLANIEPKSLDDSAVRGLSRGVLSFDVLVEGEHWLLSCCADTSKSVGRDARDLAGDLSGVDTNLLASAEFLEAEMLVFDEAENSHRLNILLTRFVEGQSLAEALLGAYAARDAYIFDLLRKKYAALLCDFASNSSAEFKLRPRDIVACKGGRLKLTNYDCGVHTQREQLAFMLLLVVLRSNMPSKLSLRSMSVFPAHALRGYIPVLERIAQDDGLAMLARVCAILLGRQNKIFSSEFCDLVCYLSDLELSCGLEASWQDKPELCSALSVDDLIRDYDYFGPLACGRIAVEKNGKWGYLNAQGAVVVALEFDWADDFALSHAVVMAGYEYGLIDGDGNFVVPLAYETLEWDAENGLAIASIDGYFGAFDSAGNETIPFKYRWIAPASCGLLPAMDGSKYGYINTEGKTIVPFIYDEVYSFENGLASVVLEGEQLTINALGEVVEMA